MKGKKPVKKSNSQIFRVLFGRGIISKICFGIIVFFLILAIFAPIISPYSPTEQQLDNTLAIPSKEHLLGTDFLGRDLLSRIVYGARISLVASLCSSLIAACLGTLLGISAGYFGGFWGNLIMRISDAQLSIPNGFGRFVFQWRGRRCNYHWHFHGTYIHSSYERLGTVAEKE